jgi:hypothetical protein
MTLRITAIPKERPTTLRLEGRLGAEEVPELERSVDASIRHLDLRDLVSADEEGVAALRRLRGRGLKLKSASRYFALRLA